MFRFRLYVGESPHAAKVGVTTDRLEHGSYRIASGEKWLALIGDDSDFTPKESWEEDVGAGKPMSDEVRLKIDVTRLRKKP